MLRASSSERRADMENDALKKFLLAAMVVGGAEEYPEANEQCPEGFEGLNDRRDGTVAVVFKGRFYEVNLTLTELPDTTWKV
jgi:hypothetical protein